MLLKSPHKYGVLSIEDAAFMDMLLATAATMFREVRFLEIGVAGGSTMNGVHKLCTQINAPLVYAGVDGAAGRPDAQDMIPNSTFYEGLSEEVHTQIPNGWNVLFIDACHCVNHVMLDFLNYSPKVVQNGYVLFHDTNPSPMWQGQHYQHHGPKDNPEFCVGVRIALERLGLIPDSYKYTFVAEQKEGNGQGMMLFRKRCL